MESQSSESSESAVCKTTPNNLTKTKNMKKLTYAQQIRKAAVTRLTMNKKLTGPERRRCFRAMETIICRGGAEAKPEATRFEERLSRRPLASLGKWHRRVTSRLVVVERGVEAAMMTGMTKLVDILSVKKDRMIELRDALVLAITHRNKQSQKTP